MSDSNGSKRLQVSTRVLNEIKRSITTGKKIQAIKQLRSATKTGLKEAKYAVERMEHEMGLKNYPQAVREGHKVGPLTFIRSITFDLGGGELTVDLEAMEMRALMGLDVMGIEEVARVLDLVKILKAFSEGGDINIASVLTADDDVDGDLDSF